MYVYNDKYLCNHISEYWSHLISGGLSGISNTQHAYLLFNEIKENADFRFYIVRSRESVRRYKNSDAK